MKNFLLILVLIIFSACNGGGGGSSSSSSNSSTECTPTISVGGQNYNPQLCLINQQVQEYCTNQGYQCRGGCVNLARSLSQSGIRGAALQGAIQSCNRVCDQENDVCLYQNNSYPASVCEQPQVIPNPDCTVQNNNEQDQTSGTTTGGTTTVSIRPIIQSATVTPALYASTYTQSDLPQNFSFTVYNNGSPITGASYRTDWKLYRSGVLIHSESDSFPTSSPVGSENTTGYNYPAYVFDPISIDGTASGSYALIARVTNAAGEIVAEQQWSVTTEPTTGGTTTGGTTTGGTTTGGTTTGGTTTGGTTTGGTTTGGTTTGGTTTGGNTTGGNTTGPSTGAWETLSNRSAPNPRSYHSAIWTGTEMIVFGGTESYIQGTTLKTREAISGGRYNPGTDSWITMRDTNLTSRSGYSVVWTGTEMIVWGGSQPSQQTDSGWVSGLTNTGSSYNPSTNSWNPTSITGAPPGSSGHTAIWTGTRMIIWGSGNAGSSYNPINFTWTVLPSSNAPSDRSGHTAVWTGSEMIIWGGNEFGSGYAGGFQGGPINTGGKYDPSTNSWSNVSTIGAPTSRQGHSALWTGTEMIVWGGALGGGRYNPQTNTWTSLPTEGAPGNGVVVWTGSEMIVWKGIDGTGAIYDLSTNTWRPLDTQNAPSAYYHSSIWTGTEMIIWGGINRSTSALENTGGKLVP